MEFMNSYKRLDNLCRDMNGIGITGYIEDREIAANGAYYVHGWKEDYLQLKRYRHIRNRIAHENDIDEFDICSDQDEIWLRAFYQRIMTQKDPLGLYYKATRLHATDKASSVQEAYGDSPNVSNHSNTEKNIRKSVGCSTFLLFAIVIIVLVAVVLRML